MFAGGGHVRFISSSRRRAVVCLGLRLEAWGLGVWSASSNIYCLLI